MSKSTFPIVGIPTPEGHPIPLRQEITAWADDRENAHQVSLFLRALIKIKDLPVEDQLGYFQIAGLSGYFYCIKKQKLTRQVYTRTHLYRGTA